MKSFWESPKQDKHHKYVTRIKNKEIKVQFVQNLDIRLADKMLAVVLFALVSVCAAQLPSPCSEYSFYHFIKVCTVLLT